LGHPPLYDGRKRSDFLPWLTQVKAKLVVDMSTDTDLTQFWYIHGRLEGRAAQQVQPWISTLLLNNTLQFQTNLVSQIIDRLKTAYDNPEARADAANKLHSLRQGTKLFSTFHAEFDRTLLEAGGLDWTDDVKKTFLSNGISFPLANALVATPVPASYDDYVALLTTTSQNIERAKLRQSGPLTRGNQHQQTRTPKGDSMDWEPTTATRLAATQKQDLRTDQRPQAKWVSAKELTRRRQQRLCFRCGKDGHMIENCPLAPAVRPDRRTTVASAASSSKPRIEEVEDSSDSEAGEGKDKLSS
jgi:hypothetical protein